MQTISHLDRIGCLLGTACGDILGMRWKADLPARYASFMARYATLPSPEGASAGTRTIRR